MTTPDWKTWTPEPWDATLNGTLHHRGRYIGEMDEKTKEDPSYASQLDVDNAARAVAAVNALAGVRHAEAVPEVLETLPEVVAQLKALVLVVRPETQDALTDLIERLEQAMGRLSRGST